jgi:hypothetical protein
MDKRRVLTPSLFGLAAILFLLPFFSVSCSGEAVEQLQDVGVDRSRLRIELTGADLVLGRIPNREARAAYRELEGPGIAHPLAIALAAVVFGAILLSGLPGRPGAAAAAVLGLVAFALLMLLGWAVDKEVHERTMRSAHEFVFVRWEEGAWAVAGLTALASAHGLLRVRRHERGS